MKTPARKLDDASAPEKLARKHWIAAATEALADFGIDGIRVEKLAKTLKVTRGSFYWHFKDREHLCTEVLDEWRRRNTIDTLDFIGRTPALDQLRYMARMPFTISVTEHPNRLALSLRLWAKQDKRVAKIVQEVDDLRVLLFTKLFGEIGFPEPEASARAALLYAYMRVAVTLTDGKPELQKNCEALLLDGPPRLPEST